MISPAEIKLLIDIRMCSFDCSVKNSETMYLAYGACALAYGVSVSDYEFESSSTSDLLQVATTVVSNDSVEQAIIIAP